MTTEPQSDTERAQTDQLARLQNPPGRSSLSYRLGTHATFLYSMLERLATQTVPGMGCPLIALTTRALDDPAIALLDSWAMVGDVLTFYQERIANEGYMRTATELRSVMELARALGYEVSPGVAASAYVVFTVATTPGTPPVVTIPTGTRVQSVPGPNESPQTFETLESIEARAEWNALRPQLLQPQSLTAGATFLDLTGTTTLLQPGAPLLWCDAAGKLAPEWRVVQIVEPDTTTNRTRVTWPGDEPLRQSWGQLPTVQTFRQRLPLFGYNAPDWHTVSDELKVSVQGPNPIDCLASAPDGNVLVTGHADGNVWVWRIAPNGSTSSAPLGKHDGPVRSVALSPNFARDHKVLSGSADTTLKLWTIADPENVTAGGTSLTLTGGHTLAVNSVAFSPGFAQDRRLLSGSDDKTLCLWTLDEPLARVTDRRSLAAHTDAVNSVAFAPTFAQSRQLLSGSADTTVKLWTLDEPFQAGVVSVTLSGHALWVTSVAFSPNYANDKQVLSGSGDRTVRLWSVDGGGRVLATLTGHQERVTSVTFSPNYSQDKHVLSGSGDGTLRLWSPIPDQSVPAPDVFTGHILGVNGVVYRDGGRSAVSASSDKTLILWNMTTKSATQIWLPQATQDEWPDFALSSTQIDLSIDDAKIFKGDTIILVDQSGASPVWQVCQVEQVTSASRRQFALTAKVTALTITPPIDPGCFHRRSTVVFVQRQALSVADVAMAARLDGNRLQLDRVVDGLQAGQLLALRGETYDTAQGSGSGVQHSTIVALQTVTSDSSRTTLTFTHPLEMPYLRPTVTLYANLALATHGETVQEDVLGSGNGSQANQSFTLHRQPLTYISAPTATGRQSTLTVRVNQVAWQEAPSIYGLDVNSQNYLVRQDEHGHTQVIFGDGIQGQRLPSGQENVVATYRVGTGLAGEVGVDALSLMPNKPLGVESVTNPLRAAGAAPRDDRDAVRLKAPRLVSTLGRIVSLQDFADFALTFGGIGKVQVAQVWNGRTRVIHLTVLGVDQQVIADNSALYNSLVKGIDAVRVPHQMVKVQSGAHLLRRFNVKARILVDAHYQSASVQAAVTDALRSTFTFTRRNFGQDVVASDLVALMQGVRGVRAVELVALYIRGCAAGLASRLEAPMARWNGTDFEPAQLLLINTEEQDGITLLLEMAHA